MPGWLNSALRYALVSDDQLFHCRRSDCHLIFDSWRHRHDPAVTFTPDGRIAYETPQFSVRHDRYPGHNMVGCYSGKPLNTQNIDSLGRKVFALIPPTPVHRFVRLHGRTIYRYLR